MALPTEIHLPLTADRTFVWKDLVEFVVLGKQIGVQDDDKVFVAYDDHETLQGLSVIGTSDGIDTQGL